MFKKRNRPTNKATASDSDGTQAIVVATKGNSISLSFADDVDDDNAKEENRVNLVFPNNQKAAQTSINADGISNIAESIHMNLDRDADPDDADVGIRRAQHHVSVLNMKRNVEIADENRDDGRRMNEVSKRPVDNLFKKKAVDYKALSFFSQKQTSHENSYALEDLMDEDDHRAPSPPAAASTIAALLPSLIANQESATQVSLNKSNLISTRNTVNNEEIYVIDPEEEDDFLSLHANKMAKTESKKNPDYAAKMKNAQDVKKKYVQNAYDEDVASVRSINSKISESSDESKVSNKSDDILDKIEKEISNHEAIIVGLKSKIDSLPNVSLGFKGGEMELLERRYQELSQQLQVLE